MEEVKDLTTQLHTLNSGLQKESIYHNIPWTLRTYNQGKAEPKEKIGKK